MIDIEAHVRSSLAAAAQATTIPAFPGLDTVQRRPAARWRRHRVAAATAATCLIVGSGVGVAAAVGVFSDTPAGHDAFGAAYYSWELQEPHSVPGTQRLLLEVPGPDGNTLRLRIANSDDKGYCSQLSATKGQIPSINGCNPAITAFGRVDRMVSYGTRQSAGLGTTAFSATVPGAASVRLSFHDGTSQPLPVSADLTIGWLTDAQTLEHPKLIGYDANGAVVASVDLLSPASQRYLACRPRC